jgi:hypothetical protein
MRVLSLLVLLVPAVALAGAKTSATNTSGRDKGAWSAGNVIDGKFNTAWQVPGESEGKGEWIELDVPRGEVDKLAIFPGLGRDDESFGDYARVKKLRVDVMALDDDQNPKTVATHSIDVADKAELQVIELPDTKITSELFGGKVRLTIEDIYEGADFPTNLAVSEVAVLMKEFDAKVKVTGSSAPADTAVLLDENAKTVWTAAAGSELTIDMGAYGISSVGFVGANKDAARPKTVEVSVGALSRTTVLVDKPGEAQWAALPTFNGYNGGAMGEVVVKIVDTYPGAKSQDLGISELKARATSLE